MTDASSPGKKVVKPKPRRPTIDRMFQKASVSTPAAAMDDTFSKPAERDQHRARDDSAPEQHTANPHPKSSEPPVLGEVSTSGTVASDQPRSNPDASCGHHGDPQPVLAHQGRDKNPAEPEVQARRANPTSGKSEARNVPWSDTVPDSRSDGNADNSCGTNSLPAAGSSDQRLSERAASATVQTSACCEAVGRPPVEGVLSTDVSKEANSAELRNAQAAPGDEGIDMTGIDLAEQKRIMHEIWLHRRRASARNVVKRNSQHHRDKAPKQPRLTDMFKRT